MLIRVLVMTVFSYIFDNKNEVAGYAMTSINCLINYFFSTIDATIAAHNFEDKGQSAE